MSLSQASDSDGRMRRHDTHLIDGCHSPAPRPPSADRRLAQSRVAFLSESTQHRKTREMPVNWRKSYLNTINYRALTVTNGLFGILQERPLIIVITRRVLMYIPTYRQLAMSLLLYF
ncbi:hypothetical protein J6590_041398 [Homalodisca vitripennis]|nr:hypothetical protein J6590_041398 [Homalodisca vitripennis]